MEELTQLHDTTNAWAKALGTPLTSIRTLPNLYKAGLPAEVVSWSVKEVAKWVRALGLPEWEGVFTKHRIQGDVMFSLTEQALKEMGVSRIGDRLYIVDCLQSLYEELTSWKKKSQVRSPGAPGVGQSPPVDDPVFHTQHSATVGSGPRRSACAAGPGHPHQRCQCDPARRDARGTNRSWASSFALPARCTVLPLNVSAGGDKQNGRPDSEH
jgi:hypothetical protein